jgi:hypothetical protein
LAELIKGGDAVKSKDTGNAWLADVTAQNWLAAPLMAVLGTTFVRYCHRGLSHADIATHRRTHRARGCRHWQMTSRAGTCPSRQKLLPNSHRLQKSFEKCARCLAVLTQDEKSPSEVFIDIWPVYGQSAQQPLTFVEMIIVFCPSLGDIAWPHRAGYVNLFRAYSTVVKQLIQARYQFFGDAGPKPMSASALQMLEQSHHTRHAK